MQKIKEFYSKKENYIISFGAVFALIGLGVPVLILILSERNISVKTFEALSPVGDFLGGTTASFLALASMLFVVAAIVMQKEELKLQRDELKLTREELEKTREEHALSNKTMKLQQFESTLFNMISIHGQLINDLKITYRKETITGREVILHHLGEINEQYEFIEYHKFIKDYINEIKSNSNSKNIIIKFLEHLREINSTNRFPNNEDLNRSIEELRAHPENSLEMYEDGIYIFSNYEKMLEIKERFPEDELVIGFSSKFTSPNVNKYKEEALRAIKINEKQLLSHYLKSVNATLDLIDSNDFIKNQEKEKYVGLFFSQFTIHEITILVYYANLDNLTTLKNLLKKYDVTNQNKILPNSITIID